MFYGPFTLNFDILENLNSAPLNATATWRLPFFSFLHSVLWQRPAQGSRGEMDMLTSHNHMLFCYASSTREAHRYSLNTAFSGLWEIKMQISSKLLMLK